MRFGINLLPLGRKLGSVGGIEAYVFSLLKGMLALGTEHEFVVFLTPEMRDICIASLNLHTEKVRFKRFGPRWNRATVPYFVGMKLVRKFLPNLYGKLLGNFLKRESLVLLHFPFCTIYPLQRYKMPIILTVADLQHEYYPEFFSSRVLKFRKKYYPLSAQYADKIIAISQFTKNSLVEIYNVPPEKIEVIYPGYDEAFHPIRDAQELMRVQKKYHLPDGFIFYPAATWPHKNHVRLLEAIKILKDQHKEKVDLILTGSKKQNQRTIMQKINDLGLQKQVRFLGFVSYSDMPALYNLARLLVFPSLFEGFGIPIVEAMACGLPVVASNATCLPEVGGDAISYCDPEDPNDIAKKILQAYRDEDLREKLIAKGLERAKLFSWKGAAQRTLNLYIKVGKELG